jgi:hypothetical protein
VLEIERRGWLHRTYAVRDHERRAQGRRRFLLTGASGELAPAVQALGGCVALTPWPPAAASSGAAVAVATS